MGIGFVIHVGALLAAPSLFVCFFLLSDGLGTASSALREENFGAQQAAPLRFGKPIV